MGKWFILIKCGKLEVYLIFYYVIFNFWSVFFLLGLKWIILNKFDILNKCFMVGEIVYIIIFLLLLWICLYFFKIIFKSELFIKVKCCKFKIKWLIDFFFIVLVILFFSFFVVWWFNFFVNWINKIFCLNFNLIERFII